MDFELTKKAVSALVKAGMTPCLVGPHGVGKTQLVREWAEENKKLPLRSIRVGQLETGAELVGLPYNGDDGKTRFAPLKRIADAKCIFLDEINRPRSFDVLQAVFALIEPGCRELGDFKLADDVAVIAAMNPDGDAYDVVELDSAFLDRMCFLRVDFDFDALLDYLGHRHKSDAEVVIEHLSRFPEHAAPEVDFKLPRTAPTPRSWEYLIRTLKVTKDPQVQKMIIAGFCGPQVAQAMNLRLSVPPLSKLKEMSKEEMQRLVAELDAASLVVLANRLFLLTVQNQKRPALDLFNALLKKNKDLCLGTVKRCLKRKFTDALDALLKLKEVTEYLDSLSELK